MSENTPTPESTDTPAIVILKSALSQVDEVLSKSEATLKLLQENINQVTSQRIGLTYQKGMLSELITAVKSAESKQ
jgi:hypothetical protein